MGEIHLEGNRLIDNPLSITDSSGMKYGREDRGVPSSGAKKLANIIKLVIKCCFWDSVIFLSGIKFLHLAAI